MSSKEQAIIYSEVYGIINMLGKDYIDLIPQKIYNFIEENKDANYTPIYDINKPLSKQNIKKRTASFMCMLYYKYFCQYEKEKTKIKEVLEKNEKIIKEKYNINKIFEEQNSNKKEEEIDNINNNTSMIVKEEKWYIKILKKIKQFFKK